MSNLSGLAQLGRNSWIIARFELYKLFLTKRGIAGLVAFSIVWYFIFKYPVLNAAELMFSSEFKQFSHDLLGGLGFSSLTQWPVAEITVFWLSAIILFPMFSLFICADQVTSDKSRGTLRFLTLRTSRDSVLLGRFLGQILVIAFLIMMTSLAAVVLATWRDSSLTTAALLMSLPIGLHLLLTTLPYIALMSLCSNLAKSPRTASFAAIILLGVLVVVINVSTFYFPVLSSLTHILPGAQLLSQLSLTGFSIVTDATLPLLQTVTLLVLARFHFNKADL